MFLIKDFKRESTFYKELEIVVTIKSFDLKAIRQRYIESRRNNISGRTGSVERRKVSLGGVAHLKLKKGKLDILHLAEGLEEPRGIDYDHNTVALSLENVVWIFGNGKKYKVSDKWFSYIHTVDFHPHQANIILVTSSGFECLIAYDYKKNEKVWEWFAWENGFHKAVNHQSNQPVYLTRRKKEAEDYKAEGKEYIWIEDPLNQVLPTAKRAAFINTAKYDINDPQSVFLTLFHEGSVRRLDIGSGMSNLLIEGMVSPHGGHRSGSGQVIGTNTGGGSLEIASGDIRESYSFKELPGKPEELENLEWLQNSVSFGNLIVTIDSNRNSFVILDLQNKLYDIISYDLDWAVQDIIPVEKGAETPLQMLFEELS